MNLTYTTDPATGAKTAPDGTVITDGIAAAVDRLAYLEGWAMNVQPPDLGGVPVHLFAFSTEQPITEQQMRDMVRACEMYGVKHELADHFHWNLRMVFGRVSVAIDARKEQPSAPKPTTAKDLLFR